MTVERKSPPLSQGTVYLIHFDKPYKHARHYLGWSQDIDQRLQQHQSGNGARLMEVITQAGILWHVSSTWDGGPELEKALKTWKNGSRHCFTCLQERIFEKTFSVKTRPSRRGR